MYPKFIELHDKDDSELISVNVENICGFNRFIGHDGEETTAISTNDGSLHVVSETYDEVKQMIKDSGIHIHKADPRLDTSNPITKQMIMSENMVGEPVWNSNNGRWYQIANWANHEDQFYMELQGVWEILKYTDKELKKFPLYRTKQ